MLPALGVLWVLLYFSQAYLYFFSMGLTSIKPVYWYWLTLAVTALALAVRRDTVRYAVSARPLIVWAVAVSFVFAVSFAVTAPGRVIAQDTVQSFITKEEMLLLLALFGILYQDAATLRLATAALVALTLLGTAVNIFELVSGVTVFSPVAGRAAGLYEDSNFSGTMLVAGTLLSVLRLPLALRLPYCLFVGVGVFVTFSRSAMMLWAAAVLGMLAYGWLTRHRKVALVAALIGLAGFSQSLAAGGLIPALEAVGAGGLLNDNTRGRVSSSFLDQQDFSTRQREEVAWRAFEDWQDAPVAGHGIGFSDRAPERPHNQYLELAADMGSVGLALALALLYLLVRSGTPVGVLFAIQLSVSNFFSHNNLEYPAIQVAVAIAMSSAWKELLPFDVAARRA